METFAYKIGSREVTIDLAAMNDKEKVVLSLISFNGIPSGTKRITQRQIANSARWLGVHPVHEKDLKINKSESTLRQIRQIVRDLRIKHHAPILSDAKGYWIPKTMEEVSAALDSMEAVARSQAAAWFETYHEMTTCFGTQTRDFFEGLKK